MAENLNIRSSGKRVQIHTSQQLSIIGYRQELETLLENMMDNQVKYAENEIVIRGMKEENKAALYFYNDGEKIVPEMQGRLFSPFAKGEHGKHGLGLSIVKEIAAKHQGTIEYLSHSEGTAFKILLGNCTEHHIKSTGES